MATKKKGAKKKAGTKKKGGKKKGGKKKGKKINLMGSKRIGPNEPGG
jgi:hypothetical protein